MTTKIPKKKRTTDATAGQFSELKDAWQPLVPFKIDEIVDGTEGLKIRILGRDDDSRSGVFAFDVYYGYRNFDEGDVWMYLEGIGVTHNGVFVADQSEFIAWAVQQSIGEKLPSGVRHYIFASIDDIFEVLAFDEPSFELLS